MVGLKATHGRIPYTGHFPRYLSRYWHIGPMARSGRDIATTLKTAAKASKTARTKATSSFLRLRCGRISDSNS
jgi:Asp-tRNA(Asn)/Glu-tRNA(Gln) amidotransferase A subunit family amidase